MAARFFINGGVNNNWSNTANWSATSGGTGGQTVPTATDTVTFDTHSPNCIIDIAANAQSLTCTSYSNTLTFTNTLTVNGNIALGSAMSFAGTSALIINVTSGCNLTTNTKSISVPFTISNTTSMSILTLIDDCTCANSLNIYCGGGTLEIDNNNIYTNSNLTISGNGILNGTSTININGNGSTFNSDINSLVFNSIIINVIGSITFTGYLGYAGNSIIYSNGSVNNTAFVLGINGNLAVGPITIDTNSLIWNAVDISQNPILNLVSSFKITNCYSYAGITQFSGTSGFIINTLYTGSIILAAGITYSITNFISVYGNSLSVFSIKSDTPGTKSILNYTGTNQNLTYCNATDIDSSGGNPIYTFNGILNNTINWKSVIIPKSTSSISVN